MEIGPRRQVLHRAEHHRDVLLFQQRRDQRRLGAADDDDANLRAIRERDRVLDVGLGISADEDRRRAVDDGHERFQHPIGGPRRRGHAPSTLARAPATRRRRRASCRAPSSGRRRTRRAPAPPRSAAAGAPAGTASRCRPTVRSVACSHVQPSRFMTATSPPRMPPSGATPTVVTPFDRATGMPSLSTWNATRVRSSGLSGVCSDVSWNPRGPGSSSPSDVDGLDPARIDLAAGGVDDVGACRHRHVGTERHDAPALDDDGALLDHRRTSRARSARS